MKNDLKIELLTNSKPCRYWWVNQNQTYKAEISGGFLWSPKTNANGAKNQFYTNMTLVSVGDIVFSFCDTKIKAVGRVKATAITERKPNFGNIGSEWLDEGWYVSTDFYEFKEQLRPKDYIDEIRQFLPEKYSPLQSNGNGNQSIYLAEVNEALAFKLIELIGQPYYLALGEISDEKIERENSHQNELVERRDIGPTTKEQLIKSRRGQGVFKANLQLNEAACRVTGVRDIRHLRASHIKPWSLSSDEEKLSGSNGLLLSPHVDHLFDRGFISFADDGKLIVSHFLDRQILDLWKINSIFHIKAFTTEQARFLSYHRKHVFKG